MDNAKPLVFPKREVWEAYKRVRANQGAAGVDEQSIAEFEEDLRTTSTSSGIGWRRGVTFPRRCDGWTFPRAMARRGRLGIPTVSDRIAQMVVKRYWSRSWKDSTRTPMDTGPGNRRLRRSAWRGSDAGAATGPYISTSRRFLTTSIGPADAGGPQAHRLSVGAAVHRALVGSARTVTGWESRRPREGTRKGR